MDGKLFVRILDDKIYKFGVKNMISLVSFGYPTSDELEKYKNNHNNSKSNLKFPNKTKKEQNP